MNTAYLENLSNDEYIRVLRDKPVLTHVEQELIRRLETELTAYEDEMKDISKTVGEDIEYLCDLDVESLIEVQNKYEEAESLATQYIYKNNIRCTDDYLYEYVGALIDEIEMLKDEVNQLKSPFEYQDGTSYLSIGA